MAKITGTATDVTLGNERSTAGYYYTSPLTITSTGTVSGTAGGSGFEVAGGVAIYAAATYASTAIIVNDGRITGGSGSYFPGNGATPGGAGGIAIDLKRSGTITNSSTGRITGGAGGLGGESTLAPVPGGTGGTGGAGVSLTTGNLGNSGVITGGVGGGGGSFDSTIGAGSGQGGAGGVGVSLTGSLDNSGTIAGGAGGGGGFVFLFEIPALPAGAGGNGAAGVQLVGGGYLGNTGTILGGAGGDGGESGTLIGAAGAPGAGVVLTDGGVVSNGLTGATTALIRGGVGINASAAATVTNFGTIVGTSGTGIALAAGGTVTDAGTISGGNGTAISFGGTGDNLLVLEHGYSLSGGVSVAGTANTLELLGSAGAVTVAFDKVGAGFTNFGTVAFGAASGNNETLAVTNTAGTVGTVASFVTVGDIIDLTQINPVGATATLSTGNDLIVSNGSQSVSLQLGAGNYGSVVWKTSPDSGAGTDVSVAPCYCRGTLILAERGEVAVEDLAIGDLVATRSGLRPVKWIGRRGYDGRFIRGQRTILPIVVSAGALAHGVPARDLWVSPEHALYLDGALVPARLLVNGLTVAQVEAVEHLEYFHIELDSHDVILAEGTPAETYIECDNRLTFHNAAEYAALYPDGLPDAGRPCAPRLGEGDATVTAIHARLLARALILGHQVTSDPGLHLIADGVAIEPLASEDGVYHFALERLPGEIWLASRCTVPAETDTTATDRRRLGVSVRRITVRDSETTVDVLPVSEQLCDGFHESEGGHRWTDGMARLPRQLLDAFDASLTIDVAILQPELRYPMVEQGHAARDAA